MHYHQAVLFRYGGERILDTFYDVQKFLDTFYPTARVYLITAKEVSAIIVLDIVPDTFLNKQLEALMGDETVVLPENLLMQLRTIYESGSRVEYCRLATPR